MGDEALRRAAREADGDTAHGVQLLRQRLRSGELSEAQLRRAASLGHPAAALALGDDPPEGDLAERSEFFLGTCRLGDSIRVAYLAARAASSACDESSGPVPQLLQALSDLLEDLDLGEQQDLVDGLVEQVNPRTPLIMGQPTHPPDAGPAIWAREAAFEAGRTSQNPHLFRVHANCAVVFAVRAVGEAVVERALGEVFYRELLG